jgi:hypothetical protein
VRVNTCSTFATFRAIRLGRTVLENLQLRAKISVVAINVLLTLVLLEVGLRVQQYFGPFYDLSVNHEALSVGLSELLNHVPLPSPEVQPDGIRVLGKPNAEGCGPKLLFMGDSFMEGLGPVDNIPYNVRSYFQQSLHRELCVFNAGYTSYSPSVYVPQAKKLIPLVKPDFVIVDVDETDLWDDAYRYRQLVVRDDAGSIVAVRPTPLALWFYDGLVKSTDKPLYIQRLASKLYFTEIEFPKLYDKYWAGKPNDNVWLSRLPEAEARRAYGADIAYFATTLDDLTQTVVSRMGTPDALIYIHHPHLPHFGAAGAAYNNIVSDTVREVASRHHVRFYDATEDLRAEFGTEPQKYYIPHDVHFNADGQRAYGVAVAKYLAMALGHN